MSNTILQSAINGDINAFHQLYAEFKNELKSYLYRLVAHQADAEDLAHDTFVKAFDNITSFRGDSSLKTWTFRIATNLAYDYLRKRKRWQPDAQDKSKALALSTPAIGEEFFRIHRTSPQGRYDIREHIDFCFTCIGKTLPIEEQIAVMLKDVYQFSRKEIEQILGTPNNSIRHVLAKARQTMMRIYDNRCALISKNGTCHQCTELAGVFNPAQNQQEELLKIKMVKMKGQVPREQLYELRAALVRHIDPLQSEGADLQEAIMACTRRAIV